jgi:hypothetical protein
MGRINRLLSFDMTQTTHKSDTSNISLLLQEYIYQAILGDTGIHRHTNTRSLDMTWTIQKMIHPTILLLLYLLPREVFN